MDAFDIRRATQADVDMLVESNCAMALETENKALDRGVVSAGVQHLIANPSAGFYVIATEANRRVGSLMITTEWSDWRNGTFWWIQSVYVAADARRRGVYRALYEHVQRLASTESDVCGFRLYVERDNQAARTTYKSLGMSETSYRLYETDRSV